MASGAYVLVFRNVRAGTLGSTDYRPMNGDYQVLFNSYYNTIGEQFPVLAEAC